jgi:hypothetical protein
MFPSETGQKPCVGGEVRVKTLLGSAQTAADAIGGVAGACGNGGDAVAMPPGGATTEPVR